MRRSWVFVTLVITIFVSAIVPETLQSNFQNGEIPKECPKIDPMNETIHLAHEWDCTKFYKCDHGKPVLFECPLMDGKGNRLHFNPILQVCDWPEDAGCINGERPTTSEKTTEGSSTPTPITTSTSLPTSSISTSTESSSTSQETTPTNTPTTPSTTSPPTSTISTSTESSSTSQATTPTNTPTTPTSTISTSTESSSTSQATTPTNTPTTPTTTISISTESSSTSQETTPTNTPTTPSTTSPPTTTISTSTESSSTSQATTPTNTPTTPTTTISTSTESSSTSQETTPTNTPTTPSTTSRDTSTVPSSISTTELSTTPSTDATSVVTDDVIQNSTVTPSGIFVAHETNCSLFWEIVGDEKILKECPRGLHFSPTLEKCVWPEEAGCLSTTPIPPETTTPSGPTCGDPCGDICHGTVIPHECSCDKFYRCANGNLILQQCPIGLHFNPSISGCDWPQSAGCLETTKPSDTDQTTTSIVIPSECPPTNSGQPIQIPHPYNCSLFYKCENGKKILSECPDDLHFNPILQMCDWAVSAGCVSTTFPTTDSSSTAISTSTNPESAITTTSNALPNECPPDNSGPPVQLANPSDCSLFYKCDNGRKVLQSCPAGLEFNAKKQECDWPESAKCTASTWNGVDTTESTGTSTKSTENGNVDATTVTISTECPPDNSGSAVHLPHPYNCSLYYKCDHGQKVVQSCSPALEFNPIKQVCDWPEDAGCVVSTTEEPRTTATWITTIGTSTEGSKSPDTSSERPTRPATTPSTLPDTSTTTTPSTPPNTSSERPTRPTTTPSTLPDTSTPTTPSTPPNTSSERPTRPSTTPESMTTSPSSTSSSTPNPAFECPPDSTGSQVPHETNCALYYECDNGKKQLKECTPGLHFNPSLEMCDWPKNAGCESTTITPESSTAEDISIRTTPGGLTHTDNFEGEETSASSTKLSTTKDIPTVIAGVPKCIGTCPSKDSMDFTVLLPNEDCTKFCKCSNSLPYVYDCPAKLHFNPLKLVCDYPRRAKCQGHGGYGRPEVFHA